MGFKAYFRYPNIYKKHIPCSKNLVDREKKWYPNPNNRSISLTAINSFVTLSMPIVTPRKPAQYIVDPEKPIRR
jgi:hypothetical protein